MNPTIPIPEHQVLPEQATLFTRDYDTLVFDMSYLLHRILHAGGSTDSQTYREMINSQGVSTGGVRGVITSIRSILNKEGLRFSDIIAIWDGRPRGLSQRRLQLIPDYKTRANDGEPDEDSIQFMNIYEDSRPRIDEMLKLLGIPVINLPYREGDDVVANVVARLSANNKNILIASDDHDYWHLVSPKVNVYRAMVKDGMILHSDNFLKVTRIKSPFHYLIYDSIVAGHDNIPGIAKGVGDTTACNIANTYQGTVLSHAEFMKAIKTCYDSDSRNRSRYKLVEANYPNIIRNYLMICLHLEQLTEPEWNTIEQNLSISREFDESLVYKKFVEYEFKALLENFGQFTHTFKGRSSSTSLAF